MKVMKMEKNEKIETGVKTEKNIEKKRVRRVGTVTMGFSLIIVGLAMSYSLFFPQTDFLFLAKFSPLILVGIGLEVLAASFCNKSGQFQYDWFSGFICFLLIVFSIGIAGAVTAAQYYLNNQLWH